MPGPVAVGGMYSDGSDPSRLLIYPETPVRHPRRAKQGDEACQWSDNQTMFYWSSESVVVS